MRFIYVSLFALQTLLCQCRVMRWISNTNFDNPQNWNPNSIPCSKDRVIFPAITSVVYVQKNATIMEMVLPQNGELVLGESVSIMATNPNTLDQTCSGQNVTFTGVQPKSWFDGSNWCEVTDVSGDCLADQPHRLHTEEIPCKSDEVVFPANSGFLVDLELGVDIQIAGLRVLDQPQTTGSFIKLMENSELKKQILWQRGSRSSTTLNINGHTCNDQSGCECGNSNGKIRDLICAKQRSRLPCPTPNCENALLPEGHCCRVCGAMLQLDYSAGFTTRSLENMIQNILYQHTLGDKEGLNITVSKLSSDQVQVVVIDGRHDDQAIKIGKALKDQLQADIDTKKRYHVTDVTLVMSTKEGPHHGAQTDDESKTIGTGSIVAIIFTLILFTAIFILAMLCFLKRGCRERRPRLPKFLDVFTQSRGTSRGDNMELERRVVFDNSMVFESNLSAFDNPTFGGSNPAENYIPIQPPDYSVTESSERPAGMFHNMGLKFGKKHHRFNNNEDGGDEDDRHVPTKKEIISPENKNSIKKLKSDSQEVPKAAVATEKPKKTKAGTGISSRRHKKLEESSESEGDVDKSDERDGDLGFGNPLYENYTQENMQHPASGAFEDLNADGNTGFENPLFEDTRRIKLEDGERLGEESEL